QRAGGQSLPLHGVHADLRGRGGGAEEIMRAYLPAYELRAPDTLQEILALLAESPGTWRPFAGGTDLMVLFEAGKLPEGKFVGLWKLRDEFENRYRVSVFESSRENRH